MSVPVRMESHGALRVVALNDPPTRNALGPLAAERLADELAAAADDATVRLVMLAGDGGIFSSGAAIRAWEAADATGETLTDVGTELCELIERLPVPVIAALPGHAVGGGAELALAADWRIADPAAELRFVHTGFGLIPGFGGLARLELLVGRGRALELLATRARVTAEEAVRIGLVDAVVPAADQVAWCVARAEAMADSERAAIAALKQALWTGDERSAFLHVWPDRQLPDRLGS
ncbi:MAG: enoyl-CoA hydratase/isomerase family protein [Gaiellales bacterium]